jgi:thioredoxin 2
LNTFDIDKMELNMTSEIKDGLIIVCPSCAAPNRVPTAKLRSGGTCGRCKKPLFAGQLVTLTSTNFDAHTKRIRRGGKQA